jgi:hypothetical protein
MNALDNFLFGYYPYICLTVFLLGSLIRFDRDPVHLEERLLAVAAQPGSCAGAATCFTSAFCSCSLATLSAC